VLVIAAPGQGAQAPGFLAPWLELPGVADRIGSWSELAGCDLIRCGTVADADEIRNTAIAQPLLVAAGIAAFGELLGSLGQAPRNVHGAAGHSVGELTAGVVAGVLSADDALRLVRVRGAAMAAAAAAESTGMTAVLGGDEAKVLASIEAHGLTPANVNGAGQIVVAGTTEQLAAFTADPPAGSRLRPLEVAGAFHTRHMAPAVGALRSAAAAVDVHDPAITLLSNRDGAVVGTGADWLERIVNQVSAPIRWDLCMRTMSALGVTAVIELPPAGTLTALLRRAAPGIQRLALKTPDDLGKARAMVSEHSVSDADGHPPEWRLLVAPFAGTFRSAAPGAAPVAPGSLVTIASELGHVEARSDRRPVVAPCPGAIIEWLVEDGDPVSVGQPLLRLQPEGTE